MSKFTRRHLWAILEATGMDHGKAAALTNQIITALAAAITAGETIELRGLGTFETRERKERTAHNPRTLAPVSVPAHRVIIF
jgi:nucleoid DNA-binding protein